MACKSGNCGSGSELLQKAWSLYVSADVLYRDKLTAHVKGVLMFLDYIHEYRYFISCGYMSPEMYLFRYALSFSHSVQRETECKIGVDFHLCRFAASGL